jgi:hypothetical protein
MKTNEARAKLKRGEPCIGTWLTLPDPTAARLMARVGFDWLTVELEHAAVNIETAAQSFVDVFVQTHHAQRQGGAKRHAGFRVKALRVEDLHPRATNHAPEFADQIEVTEQGEGAGLGVAQTITHDFTRWLRWPVPLWTERHTRDFDVRRQARGPGSARRVGHDGRRIAHQR